MKTTNELLRDADPLQHEPAPPSSEWDRRRQAILAAASQPGAHAGVRSRSRIAIFAAAALMMIVVSSLGLRVWSPFVSDLQGAVRFEVRLAEEKPGPGLSEAKVSGSDRSIYLHNEIIVDNGNIAAARIVQGSDPSHYAIDINLNSSGADKMNAATANHIGKLIAILLDGRVIMAPVIRSPVGASAVITGNFTRTQAERIVSGIGIQ